MMDRNYFCEFISVQLMVKLRSHSYVTSLNKLDIDCILMPQARYYSIEVESLGLCTIFTDQINNQAANHFKPPQHYIMINKLPV